MAVLNKEYDVIVAGGGVNGLACACYLQKSGLKVAVFERRAECGAHCCTEELMHPGVKVNLCATLMATLSSPAYEELELERFGLEMLTSSEWGMFHPINRTKKAVLMHSWDARKQYEALKRISERDAEVTRKMANYLAPYAVDMAESMFIAPTPEKQMKMAEIMMGCPGLPPDWPNMTTFELIQEMYEDENIRAALYASTLVGGESMLWSKGRPPLGLATRGTMATLFTCRGGSHALTHALVRCLCQYGGSIFTSCPVTKIIIENGEAKGIVLSKDALYPEAEIRATKAVVSNLSCHPTFLDLVGEEKLPDWAVEGVKNYSYEDIILFTAYFALSEPLDWEGYPPEVNTAFSFNFGMEGESDVLRLRDDLKAHRAPDPPIVCGLSSLLTLADPTQAPPGEHALLTWPNVPYDLDELGGPQAWDDIREEYGDKVEDLLAEYVPNFKRAKIDRYCETPLGYYRRNPSAIMGSAVSGAAIESQAGENCPFPGCGAPRSPIGKLYLSNASSPYNTTALNGGYRAADVLAQDLGVREQDWWTVKPVEPALRWYSRKGITPRWSVD